MKWVIDRFEGADAVLEDKDGSVLNVSRTLLPKEAREGDVLRIEVDEEETASREKVLREKMNRLFH